MDGEGRRAQVSSQLFKAVWGVWFSGEGHQVREVQCRRVGAECDVPALLDILHSCRTIPRADDPRRYIHPRLAALGTWAAPDVCRGWRCSDEEGLRTVGRNSYEHRGRPCASPEAPRSMSSLNNPGIGGPRIPNRRGDEPLHWRGGAAKGRCSRSLRIPFLLFPDKAR